MRILIVRFSSMGDVVMTTPIARCLHQQLGAEIHYLTKPLYEPLLSLPYIIKIHLLNDQNKIEVDTLDTLDFDIIIDLHNNLRSRKICFLLAKPVIRTDKMPLRKWLFLKLKIDLLKHSHVIDRHFKAIKALEVIDDGFGMDIPLEHTTHTNPGHIALVLGGTYATKRIPLHIAKAIITQFPQFTFHLFGGSDIIDQKESYAQYCNIQDHIGLKLKDSLRRLSQCELVISGDTGFMHIAAALQKPIISLWGSTSTLFGFAPHYGHRSKITNHIIELPNLNCRPCSKYGVPSCPKGHMDCLNKINPKTIHSFIYDIMNSSNAA